ncbi:DUF4376 domain-containing protein [Escherichia coli]
MVFEAEYRTSGFSAAARSFVYGDNQQVKLSMPELEELAAAMAQAQVDRNDEIYRRQREMKQELNSLEDLHSIRKLVVSSEKP